MAQLTYNDNQVQAENLLGASLSEGISQSTIDEIIAMLGEENQIVITEDTQRNTEELLKMKMMDEPNWRKKAIFSAMIISNNLDK